MRQCKAGQAYRPQAANNVPRLSVAVCFQKPHGSLYTPLRTRDHTLKGKRPAGDFFGPTIVTGPSRPHEALPNFRHQCGCPPSGVLYMLGPCSFNYPQSVPPCHPCHEHALISIGSRFGTCTGSALSAGRPCHEQGQHTLLLIHKFLGKYVM